MKPLEIHKQHDIELTLFVTKATEIVIKQDNKEIKIYQLLPGDHASIKIN